VPKTQCPPFLKKYYRAILKSALPKRKGFLLLQFIYNNIKIPANLIAQGHSPLTIHYSPLTAPHLAYYRKLNTMLIVLLIAAGLIGFAIFFKAIDFFEKI